MFTCFNDGIIRKDNLIDEVMMNYASATYEHGYLNYTASFWATHYREAQNKATQDTLQSVLKVCDIQSRRFQTWFNIYYNMAHPRESTPQFPSIMMVGSYFGHEAVVKRLLDPGKAGVDSKDSRYGRTPLSWAAGNGHEAVVKLFLDTSKADVDSKDSNGQTPLSLATGNGHEGVVKLLQSARTS
jgi:ankyrin repeat domain-containing protein 50